MKKQIKMIAIAAMAGIIGMIPCVGAAAQDNAAQNKDIVAAENIILIKNDDGTKYEAVYDFDTSDIPEGKKLTLIPDTVDKIGGADLSVHIGQDTIKKNDDVKITFTSTGFAGGGDYSVIKTVKGYLSDDYKAYEIPVMSDLDFEYVLSEENKTITLTKYKGTDTEIVIYPQYHIGNTDSAVYDTIIGVTKYGIADGGYGSDFTDGEYEGTNPDDITYTIGDGVFAGNTAIKSVTFLDGVKIGSHKDYMIQSDNIYAPDYEGGEYSYHGYRYSGDPDEESINIQGHLDKVDSSGNAVYKDVDGRDTVTVIEGPDMKGMFTGCTSLVEVKNIPDDVVKMTNTFRGCKALKTVTNLPSKLLDMEKTFMDCESLAEVPQIPEKVVNMLGTFRDCKSLNPKTELRVPQTVRNLMETFENCNVMEKTPVVSSKTHVRNLFYTFYRCKKMEALPILPESAVLLFRTFYGCESATGVINDTPHIIGNNKTTAPIDLIDTYRGCKALNADIYVDMDKNFVSNYILGYDTGYRIKYNSAAGSSEVLNKSYEELFSDSTWLYNCYDYKKLLKIRQAEAEGKITELYPGSSVESSRFEYDGKPGYNDGEENYIKAAYRQQVPKGMFWEAALAENSQIKLHLPDSTDYNNNEYNFLNGGRSTAGADGATGETSMTVSKFTNLPELMGNEDDRVSEDTPQQYVTYTFNLSCHIEKRSEQLERIEISNPPDKTEYEDGEHFDPTGMVVTAIYREYVDDVPTDIYISREVTDYTIDKDILRIGDDKVVVSYQEKSAEQPVTVKERPVKREEKLERIEISNPPDKTAYEDGEHFDPTGMVVTAIYREYVDDVPTDKYVGRKVTDYTIDKDMLRVGDDKVVVTYQEKSAEQPVTVKEKAVNKEEEFNADDYDGDDLEDSKTEEEIRQPSVTVDAVKDNYTDAIVDKDAEQLPEDITPDTSDKNNTRIIVLLIVLSMSVLYGCLLNKSTKNRQQ